MRVLALSIVLLGLGASAEARGQGRGQAAGESPWKGWYGWQLLLADGAALGLALAPLEDNARGAALGVGMTGLFANGAIVHMGNGHPRAASASLLRLPVFLFGRLVGWAVGNLFCQDTGCKDPIEDWGGYMGLGSMVVVDHLMARRPAPSPWAGRTEPRTVVRAPRTGPAPPRQGLRVLTLPLLSGRF
jgi:hypothetical protein